MVLHHLVLLFPLLHRLGSAIPIDGNLKIVKTTTAADGSVLDWIHIDSQVPDGNIASPPPLPADAPSAADRPTLRPWSFLQNDGVERGPDGTVPILRQDLSSLNLTTRQQREVNKGLPVDPQHMPEVSIEAAGDHWYASSAQAVRNYGGSAIYSLYKAWTESSGDFSLLQSAVIRYNVPKPGANSVLTSQTVEAGWINYPAQVSAPHLFTFFTTNGYDGFADNVGGWNREVRGWVQYDSTIYPGISFAPLCTRGGAQYDLRIQWLLSDGNWWLFVLDRWIGYYPASLFGRNTDASRSLQTEAGQINYYGEIFDTHAQPTRTDMGSGNWPEAGWQQSAYIRNMIYTDVNSNDQRYDGSRGIIVSDTNRYRLSADWYSTGNWGSYMYLGGPGAGGQMDT